MRHGKTHVLVASSSCCGRRASAQQSGVSRASRPTHESFLLKNEGSVWLRRKVVNLEGRKMDGIRQGQMCDDVSISSRRSLCRSGIESAWPEGISVVNCCENHHLGSVSVMLSGSMFRT